jgi:hypothetical protein
MVEGEKETLRERLSRTFLKPGPERAAKPQPFDELVTTDEIEAAIKRADDKERLVGLIAAPVAAAIDLIVTQARIDDDPPARLAHGVINKAHYSLTPYHEAFLVGFILAFVILAMAWWRKRTFLGIAMALYGLSIFDLGFWGFGIPFVLGGAWYLVRAYRLQNKLKVAKASGGRQTGPRPGSVQNKRYTPKAIPPTSLPKPNGKQRRTS